MATTQNTYTGNGSTTNYSFTFPYIKAADVKATLNGVSTTAFTLANATTVAFTSAPASGASIIIYRDTDNDTRSATFFAGSAIKAEDLNSNFDQILYTAQEIDNNALSTLGGTMTGNINLAKDIDIVYEGSTSNANETTLTVADPTADRTITFPDVTGTVVTTGDTGTVANGMIAASAVTSAKIEDGTIVNADISGSASIQGSKIQASTSSVSGTMSAADKAKIDAIEAGATADQTAAEIRTLVQSATDSNVFTDADHTKLDGIETAATADQTATEIRTLVANASDSNVYTDAEKTKLTGIETAATADQTASEIRSLVNSASNSNVYIDTHHAILDGATVTTAELNTLDGITATTTELNQLDGNTLTTGFSASSNTQFPSSSAINNYFVGLMNSLGGFVAIANENSFPNTNPDPSDDAGTVVSISDAGGMTVNSSGVGAGQTVGGTAVTINGFPTALRSRTMPAGQGLQVVTTSTLNTYDYHKVIPTDADTAQLSDDVNDFFARYRIGSSNPSTDLDAGDLFFNTSTNKMLVYNATSSAWEEVQSIGNFFFNTLSSSSATGGGSATFNGSAYRFTLSNPPTYAQQLLVSINGVIQKPNAGTSQPGEGFVIVGSDILFAGPPSAGSNFFAITLGAAVNIGAPSDGTVTPAKLSTGGPSWDSNGNVGVGVTSPSTKLHVAGGITSAADQVIETGSMNVYQASNSGSTVVYNGGWNSGSGRNVTSTIFSDGSANFIGGTTKLTGGGSLFLESTSSQEGAYIGKNGPGDWNIVLDGSNGSAEFAGHVKSTNGNGSAFLGATSGTGLALNNSSNSTQIELNYDGSASYAGSVDISGTWPASGSSQINNGGFFSRNDTGSATAFEVYSGGLADSNRTIKFTAAGSAVFNGEIDANDKLDVTHSTTNANSFIQRWFSDIGGTNTQKAIIKADGSAEYGGVVKVNRTVSGDGCFHAALNGTVKASIASDGSASFASGNAIITSAGYVTKPSQPGFSANDNRQWTTWSSNAVIVFNSATWNTGSHYSTSTGRFTAPVAGKYLVMCNLYMDSASNNYQTATYLKVNGNQYAPNGSAAPYQQVSTGGGVTSDMVNGFIDIINLGVNDYIELGAGGSLNYYMRHCTFGAYLLG